MTPISNETEQPTRRSWWKRLLQSVDWSTVALVLAMKVLLLLFALQSLAALWNEHLPPQEMWNRWDAPHYLNIAEHGYRNTEEHGFLLVFFPLYPWLIRLAAAITRNYFAAAILVSTFASVAAGLLLQRLARLDWSPAVARQAVWFFFIFPTSYFLHIGYTESLFLALSIGCFLAARTGHWTWVGVLGAGACLTRINGFMLVLPVAIEAWQQYRATRRINLRWLSIAAMPCGFAVYLWLNYRITGNWLAFLQIQKENFFKELMWPWVSILDLWSRIPEENAMTGVQEFAYVVLGLACTVWSWFRLRTSYAVWITLNWLLITSTSFVLSVPRYTLVLFPMFFLFARAGASRHLWFALISAWSLLFLALFVSRYVQGPWAF
jgi:hypothetical protein